LTLQVFSWLALLPLVGYGLEHMAAAAPANFD
jgi:hypothetical protein